MDESMSGQPLKGEVALVSRASRAVVAPDGEELAAPDAAYIAGATNHVNALTN